ncbi:MAG: rod shape-determining protein RodA [Acidobacteria bacterium]|nr:rod shape-determining protein RodA [Acidobacteriota bacterium]MYK90421.1 rod shape-determining protein RodA [Acidobacteriota bacterium]
MFEHRLAVYIDWALLGAIGILCAIGATMVFSATYDPASGSVGAEFYRHLVALAIGAVALVGCLVVDYRTLADRSLFIYAGLVAVLVLTLFVGTEQGGARRWVGIGPLSGQPSELARLVLALVLASVYTRNNPARRALRDWIVGGAVVALPFVLIARQPDLGTAVILLPVCLTVMVFAGLRIRVLAVVALLGVLATPLVWAYGLEEYQQRRISSFLDPEQDPQGAGYQQRQARITVGSGGMTGRGFLQGTQNQYNFLPVAHNDFIFSVLAEEHGFVGVSITLALYLFVILRSLDAARVARDSTGMYLVAGVVAGFAFQVVYNITMSVGLAPVKGLTLPLMSFGGSSIIATLMGFGLILNVRMRRFRN